MAYFCQQVLKRLGSYTRVLLYFMSRTYHFAVTIKGVFAVRYCHDSCTALTVNRNWPILVNPSDGNSIYAIDIAIESTAIFDKDSSIACSKHIDRTTTAATLAD